jgi:hypothetical protein
MHFNLCEILETISRDRNEIMLCYFVPMWHTSSSKTVQVTLLTPLGTLGTIWTRNYATARILLKAQSTLTPHCWAHVIVSLASSFSPSFTERSYHVYSWKPKAHLLHTVELTWLFPLFILLRLYKYETNISNVESIPGVYIYGANVIISSSYTSTSQRHRTHFLIYDRP